MFSNHARHRLVKRINDELGCYECTRRDIFLRWTDKALIIFGSQDREGEQGKQGLRTSFPAFR